MWPCYCHIVSRRTCEHKKADFGEFTPSSSRSVYWPPVRLAGRPRKEAYATVKFATTYITSSETSTILASKLVHSITVPLCNLSTTRFEALISACRELSQCPECCTVRPHLRVRPNGKYTWSGSDAVTTLMLTFVKSGRQLFRMFKGGWHLHRW